MKAKQEKIPDDYRSLRSTAIELGGGRHWQFEWYEPGPHFGVAPRGTGDEKLTRLKRKRCRETFVRLESAEQYIFYKKAELERMWAGHGPIIEGVPDPTVAHVPPANRESANPLLVN